MDRPALIEDLLARLAAGGHLAAADVPALRDAVLRREALGSTGIGRGVAVPHARHPAVPRTMGVLARCRQPVEFDSVDGKPVDVVLRLLAPPAGPGQAAGRRTGEAVLRLLADEAFGRAVRLADSADALAALVRGAPRTTE